jgi:ribosomal protein S18 acetylase RimI-like enzyme
LISKLDHQDYDVALEILDVSLTSYKIEAKILEVDNFPPLLEKVEDITSSTNEFVGSYVDSTLAGIIELGCGDEVEICRLVVLPGFFQQGVASKLLSEILSLGKRYIVTTASKNLPAVKLYEKHGFRKTGVRQITPELELVSFVYRM